MTNNNRYYQTREQRLDTIAGSAVYFRKLAAAREEYIKINGEYDNDFYKWIEETYGIRPIIDYSNYSSSAITDKFDIVDEQKYIIFNLKF